MSLIDKDALRIERKLSHKPATNSQTLSNNAEHILEMIEEVADEGFIYDVQQQLTEANNHQMQRLVCGNCGHHLMARIGQTLIFKAYPCVHCKRVMRPC